jgi:hypothetical protein
MEYYCYIGDIKKLIPAGFTFQKLYASNYKAYHKDNIFMFVVSKMILEISDIKSEYQTTLIKFILDHKDKPESFWHSTRKHSFFKDILFANWVIYDGKVMAEYDYTENKYKDLYNIENLDSINDGFQIQYELVKDILKLNEIGGVELREVRK